VARQRISVAVSAVNELVKLNITEGDGGHGIAVETVIGEAINAARDSSTPKRYRLSTC
jgi:hypothetical protein